MTSSASGKQRGRPRNVVLAQRGEWVLSKSGKYNARYSVYPAGVAKTQRYNNTTHHRELEKAIGYLLAKSRPHEILEGEYEEVLAEIRGKLLPEGA